MATKPDLTPSQQYRRDTLRLGWGIVSVGILLYAVALAIAYFR